MGKPRKIKLTKEVSYKNVELLLIAAYFVGWEYGRKDYLPDHPFMVSHVKNLREMLGNIDEIAKKISR